MPAVVDLDVAAATIARVADRGRPESTLSLGDLDRMFLNFVGSHLADVLDPLATGKRAARDGGPCIRWLTTLCGKVQLLTQPIPDQDHRLQRDRDQPEHSLQGHPVPLGDAPRRVTRTGDGG